MAGRATNGARTPGSVVGSGVAVGDEVMDAVAPEEKDAGMPLMLADALLDADLEADADADAVVDAEREMLAVSDAQAIGVAAEDNGGDSVLD